MTPAELAHIRALLDADKRWDALTDDEKAAESKRRKILGSLENTYALNRDEGRRP